jgi:hypothetical protein
LNDLATPRTASSSGLSRSSCLRRIAATMASACPRTGAVAGTDARGAPRPRRAKARPRIPSGINRIAATRIPPTTALPAIAWSAAVVAYSRIVIAMAPIAGPAQNRVPPSTLIRMTVSGTVMLKVPFAVTYDTNSAWIPPAMPGEGAGDSERNEFVAVGRYAHDFRRILVVVDREQAEAEPRSADRVCNRHRRDREHQRHHVERSGRSRRELRHRDRGQVYAGTTVDGRIEDDRRQHERGRQRQQREQFAANVAHAEHDRTQSQTHQRRDESGGRQRPQERYVVLFRPGPPSCRRRRRRTRRGRTKNSRSSR